MQERVYHEGHGRGAELGDTPVFWVRTVIRLFRGGCGGRGGFGRRGGLPHFGGIGFGRRNRLPHLGGGGGAGCLIRFQLAEAAVDGALDAGFVAGEFGEGVGTLAIDVESAGREVALVGRDGWRRRRFAVLFGVVFFGGVPVLAALFLGGHVVEAVQVVVEEEKELFGILVEEDMFVGAQAVKEAIAAGCGFALGGRGPVDFLAFCRLALILASLGVRGSFGLFICVLAGA